MRWDWIVTIGVLLLAVVAYALSWRAARERLARRVIRSTFDARAEELMVAPVHTMEGARTAAEAAALMLEKRIGCLPIVDEAGRLIGMLTESDLSGTRPIVLARAMTPPPEDLREPARTHPVRDLMTTPAITAAPDEPAGALAERMIAHEIHHLPVVDGAGRPVGMVTRHDLLRLLAPGVGGLG